MQFAEKVRFVKVLPPQNGIERDADDSNCHNQNYFLSTNACLCFSSRYFLEDQLEQSHVTVQEDVWNKSEIKPEDPHSQRSESLK